MADFDRHTAVWNNCLQIIENNIDPQKFNTWFKPIRPVSLEGNTLTVEVPSDFFRDYIEGAFLSLLKAALKRALGADARLNYMVRPVRTQSPMDGSHQHLPALHRAQRHRLPGYAELENQPAPESGLLLRQPGRRGL